MYSYVFSDFFYTNIPLLPGPNEARVSQNVRQVLDIDTNQHYKINRLQSSVPSNANFPVRNIIFLYMCVIGLLWKTK